LAISLLSSENKALLSKALSKIKERPRFSYGENPAHDPGQVTFKKI